MFFNLNTAMLINLNTAMLFNLNTAMLFNLNTDLSNHPIWPFNSVLQKDLTIGVPVGLGQYVFY